MSHSTESEIADAVEEILFDRPNGKATIAELIDEIPKRITLSDEDWEQTLTRPIEPMWHQQVRNITLHKTMPGNAIYEGRLVAVPGGLGLARGND